MKNEYGRSLIEVIGVLAITGVMSATAIGIYKSVRNTQRHTIAAAELDQIVKNTRLLMEQRGTYDGVSVEYLIKAGALNSAKSPIGGDWSITASLTEPTFSINLTELSESDCDYFTAATPTWASKIIVNGIEHTPDSETENCYTSAINQISFIAE